MTSANVRFVRCTARGRVVGESHGRCIYPDSLVEQVRQRHAAGASLTALAREFGVSVPTVWDWCNSRRRRRHDRIVVKRVKPVQETPAAPADLSESFDANHQQPPQEQALARVSGHRAVIDTDNPTDIDRT